MITPNDNTQPNLNALAVRRKMNKAKTPLGVPIQRPDIKGATLRPKHGFFLDKPILKPQGSRNLHKNSNLKTENSHSLEKKIELPLSQIPWK